MDVVVGRGDELGQADEFLRANSLERSVLVFEGEAGVGKTTVWEAAVALATELGFRVLSARPAEAEAKLSFSGLTDLFGDVEPDALGELAPPQRRALEVALLRVEGTGRRPDSRSIATAVGSILKLLAADGPVLVAVDDLQWLDVPSASALVFALRRVGESSIRGMLSLRVPLPDGSRVVVPDGAERLRLGPLSPGALQQLIKGRFGFTLARPTLLRVHRACAGNAFYALEIARILDRDRALSPGEPLPVPTDVRGLTMRRVRRLPPHTRRALLEASALARPTVRLVDASSMRRGAEAGFVEVQSDGTVVFAHPLYASAVYTDATPRERRRCHRRLAERVDDLEERARHLGLAAEEPDEEVAVSLRRRPTARSRKEPKRRPST